MNKPLNKKATWINTYKHDDIKSAVEWLKEQPFGCFTENDDMCIKCRKLFLKTINKAFPDLCPSGDLIADKSKSAKLDNNKNIVAD